MNSLNRKNLLFVLIALSSLAFFSCASTKFEGKAALVGRVCDMQGNPVPNYHLFLGNSCSALTDAGGMFVFRDVPSDSYRLTGGGNGWCALEHEFYFHDVKSIVCIEVESLDDLFHELSVLLDDKKFAEAHELLEKNKKYNEENELFICCEALVHFCEFPSEESKKTFFDSLRKLEWGAL